MLAPFVVCLFLRLGQVRFEVQLRRASISVAGQLHHCLLFRSQLAVKLAKVRMATDQRKSPPTGSFWSVEVVT